MGGRSREEALDTMTPRAQAITEWLQAHERDALAFLEALVNQDSGTFDRAGVTRVGEMLALFIETWYEESPPASATHHTDRA